MEEEKVVDENSIKDEKQTWESKFLKMVELEDGENIKFVAHTSKAIWNLFFIGSALFGVILAVGILSVVLQIKNNYTTYIWFPIVLIVISSLGIYFLFMYVRGWRRRTYIITDKHIIVFFKGICSAFDRRIDISNINGFSRERGFFMSILNLESIEFYSPSFLTERRTILKFFSTSSSPFRFKYISHEDSKMIQSIFLKK